MVYLFYSKYQYAITVRKISDDYVGKLMFDRFRILTVCEYKRVDEEEGDGGKLEVCFFPMLTF